MFDQSTQRICIVGTGLLGASLGLALRQAGFEGRIVGVARRAETREQAVDIGAVDAATDDAAAAVSDADLVVLATPVGTVIRLLSELADRFKPTAVITDVGSTKKTTVDAAEALANPGRFIGAHPMAGSEHSGPGAAKADLYHGKPLILTPTDRTDSDALAVVEQMWRALGMRVLTMGPAEHDAAVARISHLPHVVSSMLMRIATDSGGLEAASTGLKSMTRLASGDTHMWADILQDNAEAVLAALDDWKAECERLRQMIETNDRDRIVMWLDEASRMRREWLNGGGLA